MKDDRILEKEEYILKELPDGKKITVRDLQLEVLSVMDEIHRVCEKNSIPYFLIAGSALGIVNYKGFIPWDDDMDVSMIRSDYEKLIPILKSELPDDDFNIEEVLFAFNYKSN